jgi:hypothetical protein
MVDSGLMPGIKLTGEMKEPDAITFIFFNNSRVSEYCQEKTPSWQGKSKKRLNLIESITRNIVNEFFNSKWCCPGKKKEFKHNLNENKR